MKGKLVERLVNLSVLFIFTAFIVWLLYTACNPIYETFTSEQTAKIEELAKLEQYDMVLGKDGLVYMVSAPIIQRGQKAEWRLELQGPCIEGCSNGVSSSINAFPIVNMVIRDSGSSHCSDPSKAWSLEGWGDFVEKTFHQADIRWAVAAKCYLKGVNCQESLKK